MTEKEKVEEAVEATENFKTCPFCDGKVQRLHPLEVTGIYSKCPKCGAVGGIARNKSGELYMHWTVKELADYYRTQERDSPSQWERARRKRGKAY